ncbi:reverse transcriptase [Senna tora]|uniref:Reverse transcriptase n=1 Tax=Senna tora TaxID=362788 RepID=A0A834X588_9FABA|nr:reverse transcriptase [Senna tora]
MCQCPNPQLVRLEQELAIEYQNVLNQEEELWASKARLDWLNLGDSNTSFFHASVVMRRRSNKISALKDNMGNWVYGLEEIKQIIASFFTNCFKAIPVSSYPSELNFPRLSDQQRESLGGVPSNEEIKAALWNLKPFKAAGIDGFQPGFFQSCWKFVGDSVCTEIKSIFRTDAKSIQAVKHVLESFLSSSGLSVNNEKSSIWFSPNTPVRDKENATQILGFGESPKPGKYLGLPLGISKRISDFKPFVDKVLDKVESWKAKYLSKAGKTTLINSVCSPLVSYFMQCTVFPTKEGGLGIFRSKERNIAFLAKLCWRIKHEHKSMWVDIMSHYLESEGGRRNGSPLGKGLRVGLNLLNVGLRTNIYSGRETNFWGDDWLAIGPIRSLIIGPFNKGEEKLSVNTMARDLGAWNLDLVSFDLPMQVLRAMQSVACCKDAYECDKKIWKYTSSGTFTLRSAYDLACGAYKSDPLRTNKSKDLSWVWKLKCYPKIMMFIWQCMRNALPCKTILCSKGIMLNIVCPVCSVGVESLDHLFASCFETRKVWEVMNVNPTILDSGSCFQKWLKLNAGNKKFDCLRVGRRAVCKAVEFVYLNSKYSPERAVETVFIGWQPPPLGWWKLNTDGSCQNNLIGGGGIIRDANGNWIHGFKKFLGEGDCLLAELWAIVEGVNLAKHLHCDKLIVESDSLSAVNLINAVECGKSHRFSTLVSICRAILLGFSEAKVVHIHREGNACADILAKLAITTNSDLVYFDTLLPVFLMLS